MPLEEIVKCLAAIKESARDYYANAVAPDKFWLHQLIAHTLEAEHAAKAAQACATMRGTKERPDEHPTG